MDKEGPLYASHAAPPSPDSPGRRPPLPGVLLPGAGPAHAHGPDEAGLGRGAERPGHPDRPAGARARPVPREVPRKCSSISRGTSGYSWSRSAGTTRRSPCFARPSPWGSGGRPPMSGGSPRRCRSWGGRHRGRRRGTAQAEAEGVYRRDTLDAADRERPRCPRSWRRSRACSPTRCGRRGSSRRRRGRAEGHRLHAGTGGREGRRESGRPARRPRRRAQGPRPRRRGGGPVQAGPDPRRVLARRPRRRGRLVVLLNNLANLYLDSERTDEAEPLLRRALALSSKAGPGRRRGEPGHGAELARPPRPGSSAGSTRPSVT